MTARAARWLAAGLFAAAILSGCVSMPSGGAVQDVPEPGNSNADDQFQFKPPGPQVGETPTQTVDSWLEAMTATPVSTVVARQFLTHVEAPTWNPDKSILTYDASTTPEGYSKVSVKLFGVNRLDARGRWLGPLSPDDVTLTFPMEPENGQWRISRAPDALIVDESWFETTYQSANLYFFDPSARVLVPEPVFLPRGNQLATALVRGLLLGPIHADLERSFLPNNASLDLSVTVTPDGVAQVPLRGDVGSLPSETIELMADQLAWTLRQDPQIRSIQVIADGEPLVLPGGATEFGIDFGSSYDPAGIYSGNELYGLRQGDVVRVVDGSEQRITGPFGEKDFGLRDVSVSLDAGLVAGVSRDGRSVSLSSVYGSTSGAYAAPRRVLTGGTDVLHPAWDAAGRLWILDRRRGGAVVSVIVNGTRRTVAVPGVTGEDVIDFLVSRDGTRLVAAVDRADSDQIVVSRIMTDGRLRGTRAGVIVDGGAGVLRIRDLGWRTPTAIFFVNAINGRQSELRSASVDGSPATFDPDPVYSLEGDLDTQVLSSPRPSEPIYLQTAAGVFNALLANSPTLPAGVSALHYVG
jgi:hypothetical protein